MKASKDDTWRLRYLRILTEPTGDDKDSQEVLQAIEDLVDEKLIRGSIVPDSNGVVRGAALIVRDDGLPTPTLKGRLFIDDQRAILRSKTFFGRLKANWPLFSGIFGIIIGWSLGLVSPLIQQRLYSQAQQQLGATPAANHTQQAVAQPKPLATPAASVSPSRTKP